MDGYRRLERTRTVATPSHAVAASAIVEPGTARRIDARRTARRFAGALRLLAFVAVIATIIGTSVTLAQSTGSSSTAEREPAADTSATARIEPRDEAIDTVRTSGDEATSVDASARDAASTKAATDTAASEQVAPAEPTQVPAATTARAATSTATSQPLPLTGPIETQWVLLAGALLVLVGMAVQVAGQPLPAHARTRR